MSNNRRPMTAAAPPGTAGSTWSDGGGDDHDDSGMFSFLPPTVSDLQVGGQEHSSSSGGGAGAFVIPPPAPYFLASRDGDHSVVYPPNTAYSEYSVAPRSNHPAAAKRQRRDSDASEEYLRAQSRGQYGSQWEDQARSETSSAFGIDENGRRIEGMRMEDRGAKIPTRSEDEKMIAQYEAEMARLGLPGYELEDDDEDSPFPEVRASVSNYDDPEMPVLTFRAWAIGLFFACLIGSLNTFFTFRYPAPTVTPVIIQVISYPVGKFLAWILPTKSWKVPKFLVKRGWDSECSLNPGPFNIKEHTIIVMMGNVCSIPGLAVNFSMAADKFYNLPQGIAFDFLLVLTTQMIGFGIAGLARRFLVWPASIIWPQNLVFCTLLNTLHAEDDSVDEGGGTSRYRFFIVVAAAAFAYYFLPGFLFQALSAFSYICWAAPNNRVVNQLFGVSSGLGMGLLTFDWAQIAYIGSPLVVPWWAEVNVFVGFFIAFWIIAPALYYSNVWFSAYLPMSTAGVFDRFGQTYDSARVIDMSGVQLNVTAYDEYSPLYLPITYTTLYAVSFAVATAILVHTGLYYGKDIKDKLWGLSTEKKDIHNKLMEVYAEVPNWWYAANSLVFLGMAIAAVHVWDVQTPIWALIVALATGALYVLPAGFIFGMTSQQVSVNLLLELMAGYMLPGKPLANMIFKIYSTQVMGFALTFTQDLKFGHYMKIPPRATFICQIAASLLSCLCQVGIKEWLLYTVPDLCSPDQTSHLVCPYASVMYSASVTWGLIGPARQFGIGKLYNPLLWFLLGGALLPVPFWLAARRWPQHAWLKLVNIPVLLAGVTFMPPATGINYSSWFLAGFLFQWWARRRYFRWWSKYNFITSAGLDCGTVLCTIIIFVCLQLPRGGTIGVKWWGNEVFQRTADWAGVPYLSAPEAGFGPTSW